MTGVRLLVGTRKGAFVLTSDEGRRDWKVNGPHFAGWEIYHLAGTPIDPDRIWASQSGGWFGQVVQRSTDGGQTWDSVGNDFTYASEAGTHQHYDGTLKPWVFNRVWHLLTCCAAELHPSPRIVVPEEEIQTDVPLPNRCDMHQVRPYPPGGRER